VLNKSELLSEKEIKKQGFVLAESRYNELLPILQRLNELEAQQVEEEEDSAWRRGRHGSSRGKVAAESSSHSHSHNSHGKQQRKC
jgi:hypothetical protein